MKIAAKDPFHLTYCTNIHPGESWQEVFANLQKYVPELKARLSPEMPFAIGLRLANTASKDLLANGIIAQFQQWLDAEGLYVFTLNGFPYGGFHGQIIKDRVYAPDWSMPERLAYTLRLANILAMLLPEEMDGGISSLPLSYKPWLKGNSQAAATIFRTASQHLAQLTAELIRLRNETGKLIHLDLEPEPDGLIENAAEVVKFFTNWLLPMGKAVLAEQVGISPTQAEESLREHIRLCYDTCHFAVEYEDPAEAIALLQAAGIRIGKIQISAALRVLLPDNEQVRGKVCDRLRPFAESTYLHQVIERYADGALHRYRDLATALAYLEQTYAVEWRTHFHVPIFIRDYQKLLQSTQDDILKVFQVLRANPVCPHLEIETYTWDVLPPPMKIDLLTSIQREYEWVLNQFALSRCELQ